MSAGLWGALCAPASHTCSVAGCSFQPGGGLVSSLSPGEVGSSEPLFQAGWGLQCPCPPPQGQWMGGRDVCLMPAPDASHSPAVSSWFQLLHCLDEGSHAEWVGGAGQQLSLLWGWVCPGSMLKV